MLVPCSLIWKHRRWSTDFEKSQKVFDGLRNAKEQHGNGPHFEQALADIEAMTIFHRTGKVPPWPEFFADWKAGVERGEVRNEPFRPKPVPRFRPVRIVKQEVLQERK